MIYWSFESNYNDSEITEFSMGRMVNAFQAVAFAAQKQLQSIFSAETKKTKITVCSDSKEMIKVALSPIMASKMI